MNVIIADDSNGSNAMSFIRLGIARGFAACGHNTTIWQIKNKSSYDVFDELKPDLLWLQAYNITDSLLQCIKENPGLRLVIRLSDSSKFNDELDIQKYPVLRASEQEQRYMDEIQKLPNPLVCQIHHHPDYIEQTHGRWIEKGFNVVSFMNFADLFDYSNGQYNEKFSSDLSWIGGYWPYKSRNLDKFLKPLLSPKENYNIKIFGNGWNVPQHCGYLPNGYEKHVLKSAKITPALHEPHSTDFGYDLLTREFNLLINKCFIVSDYVEGLQKLFPSSIIHCKTPSDFKDSIDYYINKPKDRETISEIGYQQILNHTIFDRLIPIYQKLDLNVNELLDTKQQVFTKLNI